MAAGKPRLLLVGMGGMGRAYLTAAQRRGFAVSLLDGPRNLASEKVRAMLGPDDRTYEVTGSGDEAWAAGAAAAVRDARPSAVVAFSEPHVLTAALVADELGLPGLGVRAATASRNKLLQRLAYQRHGLLQPDFRLCHDADTAHGWAAGRYPVVCKPLSEAGSKGVRVVADEGELREWAATATGPFLCEEYVTGPEFSVEVLAAHGETVFANITAKVTTPPPYCVELEHHVPAGCDEVTRKTLVAQADGVVTALGLGTGLAHVELRLSADGPRIMEAAVRTPGDYIVDAIELATGIDLFDGVVAVSAGRPPRIDATRNDAACVWYPVLPPGTPALLERMRAAAALEGVVRADLPAADTVARPLTWSLDRLGAFLLRAPDPARLAALLDSVRAAVAGEPA